MWNEPNYATFWKDAREQLFELYKIMTEEVRKVQPAARFVSPGITSAGIPKWLPPLPRLRGEGKTPP
ncbi:MAG: hypothetical protein ABIF71_15665 [Planctomycetota bacterium]